jgi:hypothetical protein
MLLNFFKMAYDWLKGKNPASIAKITAFLVVPGGILVSVGAGIFGESLIWDLARPLTISQLKTELSASGNATPKPGVAFIFEPASPDEYHVQLQAAPQRLWSSLDTRTAQANRDHLKVDGREFIGTVPFIGVSDPVTVVVEGEIDPEILVRGGRAKADNWQLSSRRSESLVAGVLLACAFAFGMSLARGFPSSSRAKQSAG